MFQNKWEKVSLFTSLNFEKKSDSIQSPVHSVPWSKPMLNNKPGLKQLQTLEECTQFLTDMVKEVENIGQGRNESTVERDKDVQCKPAKSVSVDHSKRLILSWAEELNNLNMSRRRTKRESIREVPPHRMRGLTESSKGSETIMEWARELQRVSESLGVTDDDLRKILSNHKVKEQKLGGVLPFLEFVAWSLLSQDSQEDISKIWLSAKQKKWKTGDQKYIPNSVWQWVQSASADVRLDTHSCHPWLCVSEDNREVHEGHSPQHQLNLINNHQQFDHLPCVLGLNKFSEGKHYWEVLVPTEGSWKLGVASESAPRKGNFQMDLETGYWTIWKGPKNLWACTNPPTKLREFVPLQVVGVYLDYEEGQLSFYDAKSRLHIYTFAQIFKEALYPLLMLRGESSGLKIHSVC